MSAKTSVKMNANGLRRLFGRRRLYGEMTEEIQSHIEEKTEELIAAGMTREEAAAEARRTFGNVLRVEERGREVWQWPRIESFFADVRYGMRQLRRNPGFAAVAIFTLALGIGANTAIFSMLHGILLRALPYPQPGQLYSIHEIVPQWPSYGTLPVNGGNFLEWKKNAPDFSSMCLIDSADGSLLGVGRPQWLYGAAVTSDFFSVLGVQPRMGHAFASGDEAVGGKPEIILAHALWREQFHSDPHILGKVVNLRGRGMTVIGVLPANFAFPRILAHDPEYLIPFGWASWNSKPGIGTHNYSAIARLNPGIALSQAQAQLDLIEARIARDSIGGKLDMLATLAPLKSEIVGGTRSALLILMATAALLLLIVCVNLANMLLAKNSMRVLEVALRSVFGAGRWRLARQFLTETLILASAGGFLGLALAKGGLWLLVRNAPMDIPRVNQIRLDSAALWFTLAATILAALVFGLFPALRASQVQLAEALKSSGPRMSAGRQGTRLRAALVAGEIALCAALLPGCLLLAESLRHVVLANQWMNDAHVITASLLVGAPASQINGPDGMLRDFQARNRILAAIQENVERSPGVESAGFTSVLPLEGLGWGDTIDFQEIPQPDSWQQSTGEFRFVSPGYFRAIGLRLVSGQLFSPGEQGQSVAVISESVARKLLGGRNPVGMHIHFGGFGFSRENWCRIVGVAADVRDASDRAPTLVAYFPLWLYSSPAETLVVRTRMNAASAAGAIRAAIWSADPQLAIPQERTLKAITDNAEAPRRYETSLVALFALCTVLLAMLGLYAVISYSVNQRSHEIGVRMALGATPQSVLRMVLREGMLLAAIAIAAGLAGALALTRLLRGLLFEINPNDPLTFAGVAFLLLVVVLLACWIPARRAMRVDPMVALRNE